MKIDFSGYQLGAGVATALVNSSPVVRRTMGEALSDPADLEHFVTEHGLTSDALSEEGRPTAEDLRQVHLLRDELRAVLEACTEDEAAAGANALASRAGRGPTLERDAQGAWQWYLVTAPHTSLADELAVLAGVGLLGALRALGHSRFRHCTSPACDGRFVDTSRAGRRRYCMPEVCGNRLNVANHRARQAGKPRSPQHSP